MRFHAIQSHSRPSSTCPNARTSRCNLFGPRILYYLSDRAPVLGITPIQQIKLLVQQQRHVEVACARQFPREPYLGGDDRYPYPPSNLLGSMSPVKITQAPDERGRLAH